MVQNDSEEKESNGRASRNGKNFSVSYETLVKAFIGCLLALMAWSYNEITSLRQNKADKAEVYREVSSIKDALREISEGVKRVENMHFNGSKVTK